VQLVDALKNNLLNNIFKMGFFNILNIKMKDIKQIKQLNISNLFLGNLWNNKILDLKCYNKTMSHKIITLGYD
jgi:copper homeostasis protein CutC